MIIGNNTHYDNNTHIYIYYILHIIYIYAIKQQAHISDLTEWNNWYQVLDNLATSVINTTVVVKKNNIVKKLVDASNCVIQLLQFTKKKRKKKTRETKNMDWNYCSHAPGQQGHDV